MSAHTPGPWKAEGPDNFGDWIIVPVAAKLAVAAVVHNLRPDKEEAANAHLIVAAPDLLAALKRQHDNIRRWLATGVPATEEESKEISDQIDAAIAKAEGRQ